MDSWAVSLIMTIYSCCSSVCTEKMQLEEGSFWVTLQYWVLHLGMQLAAVSSLVLLRFTLHKAIRMILVNADPVTVHQKLPIVLILEFELCVSVCVCVFYVCGTESGSAVSGSKSVWVPKLLGVMSGLLLKFSMLPLPYKNS